jgi:bifunctional oligoribonuclease and PAP phosphatase NrnA
MPSTILKELAPTILEKIKSSNHILLHCHPSPDPDSLGSVLGMKFALESIGKKVTAIKGDSEIPVAFSHFPGFNTVSPKNFGEVDLRDIDLFIALDSGSTDMISRIKPVVFPPELFVIVIDHHISNTKYGQINLVDASYPATAQMVADLLSEWGISITHDIAINLFMGMYTDTGGFKYSSTTADTLQTASLMARSAPDFHKAVFDMENSDSPGGIAFQGLAFSSVELALDDHLAISAVNNASLVKYAISEPILMGNISNSLKSVIGWDVGVSIVEVEPGNIKMSLRTKDPDKYDLSVVAKKLGGGGHKAAAGAFIKGISIEEAKKKVIEAVAQCANFS